MSDSEKSSPDATEATSMGESPLVEMVLIPAGGFWMGALRRDRNADEREIPDHKVEITKDFYVGKYPVTQELWKSVMGNNPAHFKRNGNNRPVEQVDWFDCVRFCNKLSEIEKRQPVYTISSEVSCNWDANGYRLLSEAEWEYAARGGEYHLYAGSNAIDEVAWYSENSEKGTRSVGRKKANGFGLYDMSGNVHEWVWDKYDKWIYRSRKDQEITQDPYGPTRGLNRVLRGGRWGSNAVATRVSNRSNAEPSYRTNIIGFRIARSA